MVPRGQPGFSGSRRRAVIDTYAGIRWIDVVVPFASDYATFCLGVGDVAIELLIALVVTSLLRIRPAAS
jgi:sulfoxide reductase heme-binding subunit YedZ